MALTINLSYSNETPSGDIFIGTITDGTTYGGANPARSSVAVFITGEKITSAGTVDYDVDIDAYDEETAATWTFDVEKDGWYRFKFVVIPDWDSGTSYVQYDAVYSGGVVYRATASSTNEEPPNSSYWEVISSPTSLLDNNGTATESANITIELFEQIIYPFAKVAYGQISARAALQSIGIGTAERSEDVQDYELASLFVDAMKSANTRERYAAGELIAREAATFATETLS